MNPLGSTELISISTVQYVRARCVDTLKIIFDQNFDVLNTIVQNRATVLSYTTYYSWVLELNRYNRFHYKSD